MVHLYLISISLVSTFLLLFDYLVAPGKKLAMSACLTLLHLFALIVGWSQASIFTFTLLSLCTYVFVFRYIPSIGSFESCVLGRHAKQSHSLTTIGYAHACPSISLIRCFALPPTHFCVEPILMSYLLLSLNNLCVASIVLHFLPMLSSTLFLLVKCFRGR